MYNNINNKKNDGNPTSLWFIDVEKFCELKQNFFVNKRTNENSNNNYAYRSHGVV